MGRPQLIALGCALVAFLGLNLGLERLAPPMRDGASAVQKLSSTSASALLREATDGLDARVEAEVHGLEKRLDAAASDERKAAVLRELSGAWYRAGRPALAGHYAEQVAEALPSDTAWSIAATTYSLCLRADSLSAKQRAFCTERAVPAYETAISLAPATTAHRLNLAVHLAENPLPDDPMRGILILRELNEADPDDVGVLVQLGRLALQTNQLERARERLSRATAVQPEHRAAQCLLAEVARRLGDVATATPAAEACERLSLN